MNHDLCLPPHEPCGDAEQKYLASDLCHQLEIYLDEESVRAVYLAYLFGAEAHAHQSRQSGEPYIYHPLQVARILAGLHMDATTLVAAILHDVIEDTGIDKEQIKASFGEAVAELVDGVSKIPKLAQDNPSEAQAASFQKMLMAMCRDIRVILIKLADRLHNARTWHSKKEQSRRRIAKETLEIYAPIALRLGMYQLSQELENLSFAALYPRRHTIIRHRMDVFCANKQRQEQISNTMAMLSERMHQAGIAGKIVRELKTPYYTYKKMARRNQLEKIIEPLRFHAIVDTVDNCYRLLGVVHSLYTPKPGGFKDYIAIPKSNGYQSLHTKLKDRNGHPIECHIRTPEMNQIAEFGITGHDWLAAAPGMPSAPVRAQAWVQRLLELQRNTGNSREFLENVKLDLFPDEVCVFTPKGTLIELPRGATAIDFAFAVHSDLGYQAISAWIDGAYASLSVALQNGQSVRIITAPRAKPQLEWLDFATTAKARLSIRNYFKSLNDSDAIHLGHRIVDQALAPYRLSVEQLTPEQWATLQTAFQYTSQSALFRDIGLGNRLVFQIISQLHLAEGEAQPLAGPQTELIIKGTEGAVVTLAKCCRPVPGDLIKGHVSVGRGLVVHTEDCRNIQRRGITENLIALTWAEKPLGKFCADIRLEVTHQRGVLAMISTALNNLGVNIESITSTDGSALTMLIHLTLQVNDRAGLEAILRHLRRINVVLHAQRCHSAGAP